MCVCLPTPLLRCVCVSLHLLHDQYQNTNFTCKVGPMLMKWSCFAGTHKFKGGLRRGFKVRIVVRVRIRVVVRELVGMVKVYVRS